MRAGEGEGPRSQGRPRRWFKVCSIGVNVLCERASILAGGPLWEERESPPLEPFHWQRAIH